MKIVLKKFGQKSFEKPWRENQFGRENFIISFNNQKVTQQNITQ